LACVGLIPILTILANFMGVMGGALISIQVYHIEAYHYWHNAEGFVGLWDVVVGLIKPMFFGAAIALISCHRGFNSKPGAEGVGRPAVSNGSPGAGGAGGGAPVAFFFSFIPSPPLVFFLVFFLNTPHTPLGRPPGPNLF